MPIYVRPPGEVVLALSEPIKPLTNVRSTFILGSIDGMKSSGHYDAYVRALPDEHRDTLLAAIPGVWLPLAVAKAHYQACETLGLPSSEATRRGRIALERLGGVVYGTALQMARQAGATPWTLLPSFQRFWVRAYDGGAVGVYKVGPKDARIDLLECGLCEIPYYRHAVGGLVEGLLSLFCASLYVRERRQPAGHNSLSLQAQWA